MSREKSHQKLAFTWACKVAEESLKQHEVLDAMPYLKVAANKVSGRSGTSKLMSIVLNASDIVSEKLTGVNGSLEKGALDNILQSVLIELEGMQETLQARKCCRYSYFKSAFCAIRHLFRNFSSNRRTVVHPTSSS